MIEFINAEITAQINVHLETTRDNLFRAALIAKAQNSAADGSPEQTALYVYMPIMLSVSSGQIQRGEDVTLVRELTLDQFLDLPGELFEAWLEKVTSVNPHLFRFAQIEKKSA